MHHAEVLEVPHPEKEGSTFKVLVVPDGREVQSLKELQDRYRSRPERRKGTSVMKSIDSFIKGVNRYKNPNVSLVFAVLHKVGEAQLVAVIDYHPPGPNGTDAGWGEHCFLYAFPVSDEWTAWTSKSNKPMSQEEFANFLEERLPDICEPAEALPGAKKHATQLGIDLASPATLVQLSRTLTIKVGKKVTTQRNPATGEVNLAFEEKHESAEGGPVRVPGGFIIAIPPFKQDAPYQLAVRLRYRVVDERVIFTLAVQRIEAAWDAAVGRACEKVEKETGLTLLYGSP
jgi:uncharacterized protein YfdQ (DUF2303 family)